MFANSWRKSYNRLDGQFQNQASVTVTQFLMNPEAPGLNFEPIDAPHNDHFYSIRVNRDVRIILYRNGAHLSFLYVDHHDKAYNWAARRQMEVHPSTGAVQIVEIEEVTRQVTRTLVEDVRVEPPVFAEYDDDYLLALGVPPRYLDAVKHVGRSKLYELIDHLPEEAMERLLLLADGHVVPRPAPAASDSDPFEHPDARRRFRAVDNQRLLERALASPWEQWLVFLHPLQQEIVDRSYSGPARVSGAAGTGKTVVALHRVARLHHENPEARILLTTFSKALAARLEQKVELLLGNPAAWEQKITVSNLHREARRIWVDDLRRHFQRVNSEQLDDLLVMAARSVENQPFSHAFLRAEWRNVVDALGITSWDMYRLVPRVGRGSPLGARQRSQVWAVFELVLAALHNQRKMTFDMLCHRVAEHLESSGERLYDHAVVDESQDLGPAELRLVRALVPEGPDDLFFAGDMGQRIYRGRASWLSQGVDVRGRSACLRVNYRTTDQIRRFADVLLPPELSHGDGESESRSSVSLLEGPPPDERFCSNVDDEIQAIAEKVQALLAGGYGPGDIGVFARINRLLEERVEPALSLLGQEWEYLRNDEPPGRGRISLGSMHVAKGLEFRAVLVIGCERGMVPLTMALNAASDEAEKASVLEEERQLLYVAATRGREELFLSCGGEQSEFLVAEGGSA